MKLVSAILVAASSVLLSAQSPPAFSTGVSSALEGFSKGAYLQSSNALAAMAFAPDGKVRDRMAFAMWAQF